MTATCGPPGCAVRRTRGEHGGATVLLVTCLALLLMVGTALAAAAGLVVDHRRAQAAADLAALAGATAAARAGPACPAAAAVAEANGAGLVACEVVGLDVRVRVVVVSDRIPGPSVDLEARARAGPG